MEWLSRLHRKRCYITWSMTSQQEGHSQVKVITFANSPLTWKALPISLNVPPSCNFKQALGEWTNHLHPNLLLVRGTSKRNKGINCCTDFCKLQSFCLMLEWEKGCTTLLLFTRPLNTSFSTGILQRNKENEHRDVKNKQGCFFNRCCNSQRLWCWGGTFLGFFLNKSSSYTWQKGTAKEQGHGRKSYKVFSLNPLYQIEEDYWNISFSKSWGMNNPAIFSPKSAELSQEHKMTQYYFAEWTYP